MYVFFNFFPALIYLFPVMLTIDAKCRGKKWTWTVNKAIAMFRRFTIKLISFLFSFHKPINEETIYSSVINMIGVWKRRKMRNLMSFFCSMGKMKSLFIIWFDAHQLRIEKNHWNDASQCSMFNVSSQMMLMRWKSFKWILISTWKINVYLLNDKGIV